MSTEPGRREILAVDVGGSHVKALRSSGGERRRFESGPDLTARQMVDGVLQLTSDWDYDLVSVGIPAPIHGAQVAREPVNLGEGWVDFDFGQAFGKPTKVVNDAVMQALGDYEDGTMLFLGLGTGLGSALVVGGKAVPLELAHLPFRKATFEDYVGERGRVRLGKKKWHHAVVETVELLAAATVADYVVLGGGNAKRVEEELPPNVRLGANQNAFVGGFRLWDPSISAPSTG